MRSSKLRDVCTIVGGGTPDTTNKDYWGGDIIWFTPSEVGKTKYVNRSNRNITEEGYRNCGAKLLKPKSILLSSRATIGECSINTVECCTNQGFQSLTDIKINNEYLYYYLQTYNLKKSLIRRACGSTFAEISNYEVGNTNIYLPDENLQFKLAKVLSTVDERIETQNKIIEKTKSLIKPLFEYLNKDAKKKIQITDVGKYYSADSVTWEEITDSGNPVVIYGQLFTEYKYVINNIVSKSKKKLLSQTSSNDLLFPSSTTVDAISLISPASIKQSGVMIGGDMFGIRINDDYDSDYLSFLINCSYKRELSKYAQGSTIIHLHYDDIKYFKIVVCDKKKQTEISKTMNLILEKIGLEQKILSRYQEQKKFFLNNLFI